MGHLLFARDVITNDEKTIIDAKTGREKMMFLITDIIIRSLKLNFCKKYKGFLEAMEKSDDSDLRSTAEKLGMLIILFNIAMFYGLCTKYRIAGKFGGHNAWRIYSYKLIGEKKFGKWLDQAKE